MMKEESLEHYQRSFKEKCFKCNEPVEVHAFRPRKNGNRKAIYAHCQNQDCAKRNMEICYLGG